MQKGIFVLVVAIFVLPAWASQPGHPLDCSDWVILEPGLSCSEVPGNPAEPVSFDINSWSGSAPALDPSSGILDLGYSIRSQPKSTDRIDFYRTDSSGTRTRIAYVEGRFRPEADGLDQIRPNSPCRPAHQDCQDIMPARFLLDTVGGRLLVPLVSYCWDCAAPESREWTVAISGFPTIFDILQSYIPTSTDLGFRVPAHPEGLRSADHFDTYWGRVSDLPDFTQAQPMQCHYPATPPSVGDYVTVADTSPQPTPGAANYIVTAVTNGNQRRYGRKLINGMMSGRDPALLPGCPQPREREGRVEGQ